MNKTKALKKGPRYGYIVLIVLVSAIIFGFLVDFICTRIEYMLYPQEYSEFVEKYSAEYEIPSEILYAVIRTESGFDSAAVSSRGAVGLMQMMPDTFEWLTNDMTGERLDVGMLYDPETNIRYGAFYLSWLYSKYGEWDVTFAAYNAGPTRVGEWLDDKRYSDDGIILKDIPFKETRDYVKKVNSAREKYLELYQEDKQ